PPSCLAFRVWPWCLQPPGWYTKENEMHSMLVFSSPPRRLAGAVALLGLVAGPALAQQPSMLRNLADVKKLPGSLVARAQTKPETPMQIKGYRVEQVTLPESHLVTILGKEVEVSEGWHVTFAFAAPLTVRDQSFSLIIDGRWCGFLQEGPDLLS